MVLAMISTSSHSILDKGRESRKFKNKLNEKKKAHQTKGTALVNVIWVAELGRLLLSKKKKKKQKQKSQDNVSPGAHNDMVYMIYLN